MTSVMRLLVKLPGAKTTGMGATHGLQELRTRRTGSGDDVQPGARPMRWHLASARGRVGARPNRLQQHVERRNPQRQAKGPVAIVGIKPVVARTEQHSRGGLDRLVPGPADLKIDLIAALEDDLPVIEAPGEVHVAVSVKKLVAAEAACWR